MSLVDKIKNILFEVEDDPKKDDGNVEVIKIKDDDLKEEKIVTNNKIEEIKEEKEFREVKKEETPSERELFKIDNNTFTFPDFDEEEFQSSYRNKPVEKIDDDLEELRKPPVKENRNTQFRQNNNVLEFERKKNQEKRNEYTERRERMESTERVERKKFKPSPIISPVYGVLNKDYTTDDIVDRNSPKIDVDTVRKKAFEQPKVEKKVKVEEEPEVTFLDTNDKGKFKSIDALLEEASDEITLEDTLEMPVSNNLEAIEEELEKISEHEKKKDNDTITEEFSKDLDAAIEKTIEENKEPIDNEEDLDNDLFELIDSMYEERKEAK